MSFRDLKASLQNVEKTFHVDKISEADLVRDPDSLQNKIAKARETETLIERSHRCKTASSVFLEFSRDAAIATVDEMTNARTSGDRQRAQERILEYSLGKPINRTMSLTMKVPDAEMEELDHEIRSLLTELGFAEGKGAASSILIGNEGVQGEIEARPLPTESRVSGKVYPESEEDSDLPDG